MSLYLNDEQEKALREWYGVEPPSLDDATAWVYRRDKSRRLAEAIAPLMKPWTFEPEELGWRLRGPIGTFYVRPRGIYVRPRGVYDGAAIVAEVCDLLNKCEARK